MKSSQDDERKGDKIKCQCKQKQRKFRFSDITKTDGRAMASIQRHTNTQTPEDEF